MKKEIKEFDDLRGRDLSDEDLSSISFETLVTTSFDTETKWPDKTCLPKGFDPVKVMENGKNPGLGVRQLHEQGIDGRGIHVAIIDQRIEHLDHIEYKGSLFSYKEYGLDIAKEPGSMHGPAVASLLVGKNCGVVPGAKLHFIAAPARRELIFKEYAKALSGIVEENKKLELKKQIKIVSCSIGYMEQKPEPYLKEWIEAKNRARQSRIFIFDVESLVMFMGGGSYQDKEDPNEYKPALNYIRRNINPKFYNNDILINSDYRTYASRIDKKSYEFTGEGAASWDVPYLAGVVAMVLQVNPSLSQKDAEKIIGKGFIRNKNGLKIINPAKIVELAKDTI